MGDLTTELRGWVEGTALSDDANRKIWLMHKAADAIDRLTRERDEARADTRELRMQILSDECQHQDNYQRAESMEHAKNEYATLAYERGREIERLRAVVEAAREYMDDMCNVSAHMRLVAALTPFRSEGDKGTRTATAPLAAKTPETE